MITETIDHNTLARLVEAGAVRGAHIVAQVGGWGVIIKYGMVERPLAATRSKQIRLFKKLETLVTYLKEIGICRYDVDASQYDPATVSHYKRPDRSEAFKKAAVTAEYDRWFRNKVGEALKNADSPGAVWIPHSEVKADMQRQREALLKRIESEKAL